eukprot:4848261-Pleurochrysis_carterae.AAC.1
MSTGKITCASKLTTPTVRSAFAGPPCLEESGGMETRARSGVEYGVSRSARFTFVCIGASSR